MHAPSVGSSTIWLLLRECQSPRTGAAVLKSPVDGDVDAGLLWLVPLAQPGGGEFDLAKSWRLKTRNVGDRGVRTLATLARGSSVTGEVGGGVGWLREMPSHTVYRFTTVHLPVPFQNPGAAAVQCHRTGVEVGAS